MLTEPQRRAAIEASGILGWEDGQAPEHVLEMFYQAMRPLLVEEREAIDAVCRTLMIRAAEDQSTVRAVASALDKVRVVIRERNEQ